MADHPEVVDVHSHVFNARYLPLKGIFLSHLGTPSAFKDWLAAAVAAILNHSTGSSYSRRLSVAAAADGPEPILDDIWRSVAAELEARTTGWIVAAGIERPVREYVADRLEEEPLLAPLLEGEAILATSGDDAESPNGDDLTPYLDTALATARARRRARVESLLEAVRGPGAAPGAMFDGLARVARWLLKKLWKLMRVITGWWESLTDLLTFVRRMLMAERDIAAALADAYDEDQRVERFVHHMMDMEFAYPDAPPPRYLFAEQERRMRRLADDADGALIGFTAYDPRRYGNGWSLPDLFTGVKFYPAMGYKPWANTDELQPRVSGFLRRCVEDDIPVFAHCTPLGFQAYEGAGLNAHPEYWRMALSETGLARLRLCLGHAGGTRMRNGDLSSHGWFARDDAEWSSADNFARIVVELCRDHDRVYCEVGHLDDVLTATPDDLRAFEDNFAREWARPAGDRVAFATRCMFGSDDHMPGMINRASDLLAYFQGLFSRRRLDGFADFCAGNARTYLKVRAAT
ncbi:MAG: hypothetical protein AB7H93_01500 [Vicinamibacterales bacterium]